MVQPNAPEESKWTPELYPSHSSTCCCAVPSRLHSDSKAQLIVWPEVPGPIFFYQDTARSEEITRLAELSHAWVLLGTVAETPRRQPLNSAVLVTPQGTLVDRYDKINLVPFGEYVPEFFGWVNRISPEISDFVPGNRIVVEPFGSHKLGTFICYESAFPQEVR